MAIAAHDAWRVVAGDTVFALQHAEASWVTPWRTLRQAVGSVSCAFTMSDGTAGTFGGHRASFKAPDGSTLTISGDDLTALLRKQRKAKLQLVALGDALRLCAG